MEDLEKYNEITDLNFDGENPHIAICHESQKWSANYCHRALLFKSNGTLNSEIVKSLDGIVDESILTKMSAQNKRNMLEEKLEERIRSNMSGNGDYVYLWVKDFSEDMVVFEYQEELYAVDYTESEDGIIEVGEEPKRVSRKDLYVDSETGEELIKAADWLQKHPIVEDKLSSVGEDETGETSTPEVETETEETMSVENQHGEQVITKSQEEFDALVKAQVEAALAAQAEAAKQAELTKSTSELLKGMDFVADEQLEDIVKAVLTNEQGDVVLATLQKAQEAIVKAQEDAQAEIVKVKEEFGKQEALEGDVIEKSVTADKRGSKLADAVAKFKKV